MHARRLAPALGHTASVLVVASMVACGSSTNGSIFSGTDPATDSGTATSTGTGGGTDAGTTTTSDGGTGTGTDTTIGGSDATTGDDAATASDSSSTVTDSAITPPDTFVAPDAPPVTCTDPLGVVFNNHCYFPLDTAADGTITPHSFNFANSPGGCTSRGAHLATITSDAEQATVAGIDSGDRWIGFSRPPGSALDPASFQWVTGEAVTYTNWSPGEPNGTDLCVRIRADGTWGDYTCSQRWTAICEREP